MWATPVRTEQQTARRAVNAPEFTCRRMQYDAARELRERAATERAGQVQLHVRLREDDPSKVTRAIKHPSIVLLTCAAKLFRRAKPTAAILQLVAKGDHQVTARRLRAIDKRKCITVPVRGALETHIKRLSIHRDAEVHGNRRLAMLNVDEPALYDGRDHGTQR
jgi:hypothetical protein